MDKIEAAARLGVPVAEVADVLDHELGPVIVTTDGVSYVDVADPDGAGATGLMFLAAPHTEYRGGFPVYTAPEPLDDDTVELADDGARDAGVIDVDPDELVRTRARDLGIKFRKNTPIDRLVELIATAEADTVAAAPVEPADGAGTDDDAADPTVPATDDAALRARAGELGIDPDMYDTDELVELVAAAEAEAQGDD